MSDEEITERIRKSLREIGWTENVNDIAYHHNSLVLKDAKIMWWLRINDLLAMANGMDGCIDAMKAMIHDLQEESAAYQRGVEEGRRQIQAEEKARADAELETLTRLWAPQGKGFNSQQVIKILELEDRRRFREHATEQDLG